MGCGSSKASEMEMPTKKPTTPAEWEAAAKAAGMKPWEYKAKVENMAKEKMGMKSGGGWG